MTIFYFDIGKLIDKSEKRELCSHCISEDDSDGPLKGVCHCCKSNNVEKWAVDSDKAACESMKLNHTETQIRNESAVDFLDLLKEWERLCRCYAVGIGNQKTHNLQASHINVSNGDAQDDSMASEEFEFEVSRLVDICYGDPTSVGKRGLKFKVRWKGYGPSEDTWEPIEGLSNCEESIRNFVIEGFKSKILPLPFAKATLARYALSRLVHMNYQARLGIMAAGCYGLPQFRLRVFLWGCHPFEASFDVLIVPCFVDHLFIWSYSYFLQNLPQFPLPTHEVILRGGASAEFEVSNEENNDQMPYTKGPQTEFQRYIRIPKSEMIGLAACEVEDTQSVLFDHRPKKLFEDDYLRVCQIPRKKGANFRDLPGLIIDANNTVQLDPTKKRTLLPSGKPLVPDYALNFWEGKSLRPFGRLWWDETMPTVLTVPDAHHQVVLHPEQNRVLTIREIARLQGFPDYYRFFGTVKERYRQIGNAVAVPVGKALGYAMGLAWLKQSGDEPLMTLPSNFAFSYKVPQLSTSSSEVQNMSS
ncbi:hypothetical protein J5N97_000183 [Dioscorea zingiberensis]|uniref:DNA (cytosine-5-)-methyltransferase n=1 Tax=Dioscorea zingiberensis TaxID=325984 RepID=A0A9D5BV78_9LILI|nr:hypothetical protein J5N97_000183 [Dioscorea zingiberensis]